MDENPLYVECGSIYEGNKSAGRKEVRRTMFHPTAAENLVAFFSRDDVITEKEENGISLKPSPRLLVVTFNL